MKIISFIALEGNYVHFYHVHIFNLVVENIIYSNFFKNIGINIC